MDLLRNLGCLDDDAPLENETFGAEDFFSEGAGPGEHGAAAPQRQRQNEQQQQQQHPPSPPSRSLPSSPGSEISVPLRQWVRSETLAAGKMSFHNDRRLIVRKTTVAYAIARLLLHHMKNCNNLSPHAASAAASAQSGSTLHVACTLENFVVRVSAPADGNVDHAAIVEGVDMISPRLSLRLISPFFLSDEFWKGGNNDNENNSNGPQKEELGRFVEVEIQGSDASGEAEAPQQNGSTSSSEENVACHLFGVLMYELYSGMHPFSDAGGGPRAGGNASFPRANPTGDATPPFPREGSNGGRRVRPDGSLAKLSLLGESARPASEDRPRGEKALALLSSFEGTGGAANGGGLKKTASGDGGRAASDVSQARSNRLPERVPPELGVPAPISLLVKNLLDCGWDEFRPDDAVPSLAAAGEELHLLLLEPDRFLFDKAFDGVASLDVKPNKLYGREPARSLVTDVFCRVSRTGRSEALLVDGHSGSGKSALIESVVSYIDAVGGHVARGEFGPVSQERPLAAVVAAFDGLCPAVRGKNSERELKEIATNLLAVFGTHLWTLVRLLPSVELLIPDLDQVCPKRGDWATEINLGSICFVLQLFTRVISSKTHPVMLFLDDLHWADHTSLDVLRYIMSDPYGCIYVVGTYRSNEVANDHAVFQLMTALEASNVRLNKVHLEGMGIGDVNHMISDALGIPPRRTRPLSQLVLRKTKGNPLFVLECLRSLVDRDLLQYSVRERRWVWDTDRIGGEDIADNVCELLSIKMIGLPENTRLALRIASCFGTTLNAMVVKTLMSASLKFSGLRKELNKVVDEGFMDKDRLDSSYKFVHDKVREAAYGLIPEEDRDEFHHGIGMVLYYATQGKNIDDMIFLIVDQVNHGTIRDPQQRINVATLNYKAGSIAMENSNFAAAYLYANAAAKLLPQNHWESHYDLSRSLFLVLGNAAHADGHIEESTSALDSILKHGKTLKDKLDAYNLKIALLHARQEAKAAYDTCISVLEQLGESIPASVEPETVVYMVGKIQSKLKEMTERDFMGMKTMDSSFHYSLMQFYNQACFISYFLHSSMLKWFACRLVEISLEHGFCKYSALGIMRYSMVLGGKLIDDVQESYRVGKMAMKLLDRFDATDLLPIIYLCYYGFIASQIEPFQSCADMMKRGFEIGLSTGDTLTAFLNGIQYIQKSFISGMPLPVLKTECDFQMRLIEAHSQPLTKMYMTVFQRTIAMLIAKEEPSSAKRSEDVSKVGEFSEALIFHCVVQNFWLGHFDRCIYYASQSSPTDDITQLKSILITFYGALSRFHSTKKNNRKHRKLAKKALDAVREKGQKSVWNYQSKIHLLEAEIFSASDKKNMAEDSFNAAISTARSSKFIHEQGLACEFAALHCLKHGESRDASKLFQQARECYTKWGSQVKVDFITNQLEKIVT